MPKIWTIGALLQWTEQFFKQKGIDTPRLDAEILLAHVMQKERIHLYAHYDEPLEKDELTAFRELVKKRASRISVAHLLGSKGFMGMDFTVTQDVLIPRPETEVLIEKVIASVTTNQPLTILDVGTGSGAIILGLLKYLPKATGIGADISAKALAIAEKNGTDLQLADRVQWCESDLFEKVPDRKYDWIVSNPPYLTQQDMENLQPEVEYDPPQALFGGEDGLEFYRRIAGEAWKHLTDDGHCAVEIGAGQAADVTSIFVDTGHYILQQVYDDYGKIERIIIFDRKE